MENHWLRLGGTDDGFFAIDLIQHILEFTLNVGVRVEIEVHPSGRAGDCDKIDCMVQEISIRAWPSSVDSPYVYKWEYGPPSKLKKDEDWHEGVDLLKSIELALEDVVRSIK